jgi:hypothetical protein
LRAASKLHHSSSRGVKQSTYPKLGNELGRGPPSRQATCSSRVSYAIL